MKTTTLALAAALCAALISPALAAPDWDSMCPSNPDWARCQILTETKPVQADADPLYGTISPQAFEATRVAWQEAWSGSGAARDKYCLGPTFGADQLQCSMARARAHAKSTGHDTVECAQRRAIMGSDTDAIEHCGVRYDEVLAAMHRIAATRVSPNPWVSEHCTPVAPRGYECRYGDFQVTIR